MQRSENAKITVLDCTLRDGGYCNNWQFDKVTAQAAIRALNASGVDIIEVGYKSPGTHREKNFEGLFRFCTESQLAFLKKTDPAEYAFMVDAKEFLKGDRADSVQFEETIPEQQDSLFTWARIATYAGNFDGCRELIKKFKGSGYKVTLNLMGISLLTKEEIADAIRRYSDAGMDVLYFSDSFGDLNHADVLDCVSLIRKYYKGKIGIHTHDNNGLAFANTLSAIDSGVDFIDCTIMGMGRGAGNLRTEQILLHLYFKMGLTRFNPSELLDVINTRFIPLQAEFRWGWDYTYMLSALQNIHPTYCMNLRLNNQYSIEQMTDILNSIDHAKRKKYDDAALLEAIDTVVNKEPLEENASFRLPLYKPEKEKSVLVIATGPSIDRYREELREFIRQNQPLVIECNPKNDDFEAVAEKYHTSILNSVRLKKYLDSLPRLNKPLITGITALPEQYGTMKNLYTVPCHIEQNTVRIRREKLTLPAYVVGMFSIGLALLSSPETIYLAGYDGYASGTNPNQQEMNTFWEKLPREPEYISITPTTYSVGMIPIYHFIR